MSDDTQQAYLKQVWELDPKTEASRIVGKRNQLLGLQSSEITRRRTSIERRDSGYAYRRRMIQLMRRLAPDTLSDIETPSPEWQELKDACRDKQLSPELERFAARLLAVHKHREEFAELLKKYPDKEQFLLEFRCLTIVPRVFSSPVRDRLLSLLHVGRQVMTPQDLIRISRGYPEVTHQEKAWVEKIASLDLERSPDARPGNMPVIGLYFMEAAAWLTMLLLVSWLLW